MNKYRPRESLQRNGSPDGVFHPRRVLRASGISILLGCLLACLISCGRDMPTPPVIGDITPPARVSDLLARAESDTCIILTWTATGDDGASGQATRYDIRYSTQPFPNEGHFPTYPPTPNIPAPRPAGSGHELRVNGLTPETRYHFAMRVADEAGNLSPVSNVASMMTAKSDTIIVVPPPDTTAPAAVVDLRYDSRATAHLTLIWTAPGDDGEMGRASAYTIRWSYDLIDVDNWNLANGLNDPPYPSAALTEQRHGVTLDEPLRSRHFALRTTDEAGNESDLSNVLFVPGITTTSYLVLADGTGDFPTIQAAFDAAVQGDTIRVGPGDYRTNLEFPPTSLTLIGEEGRDRTRLMAVDATKPILLMDGDPWSYWTIEGFTVEGDGVTEGGGIKCLMGSFAVRECNFIRNHSRWGGAIEVKTVQPLGAPPLLVESCLFSSNTCYWNGGAIGIHGVGESRSTIRNCEFVENLAPYDGGAVWLVGASIHVRIANCRFMRNQGLDHGGAMHLAASGDWPVTAEVTDNLVMENRSTGWEPGDTGSGGGIYLGGLLNGLISRNTFHANTGRTESVYGGGSIMLQSVSGNVLIERNIFSASSKCAIGVYSPSTTVTFRNCIAWQTDGPMIYELRGLLIPSTWNDGIRIVDPQFCDPAGGDFSLAATSPALNGGEVIGAFETPGCSAPK